MVRELLTDRRGSAGIEGVLWSLLLMIFLVLPLMMGLFEYGLFVVMGMKCGAALDDSLNQVDWQISAGPYSDGQLSIDTSMSQQMLRTACESLLRENDQVPIEVSALRLEVTPPTLGGSFKALRIEVNAEFTYPSQTMWSKRLFGNLTKVRCYRLRELPIDN